MPWTSRDQERLQRTAEALGLEFDPDVRIGSEGNMAGMQSAQLLFSQRLDSRTYFIQDQRYGPGNDLGTFEGDDQELLARGRAVMELLQVPTAEIAEPLVLREQGQVAEFDRETGKATLEEVQPGNTRALFTRQVDKLPVWSSNLILGLARDGQIGFLQLHWPEIPSAVIRQARKLASLVATGWEPPKQPAAIVESVEAGIVHSPALGFVMDIYPAIRVIYQPEDETIGRKPMLYFDADGEALPLPRQFEKLDDIPPPERPQEPQDPDKVRRARSNFKALKLANPNYFGNLVDSPFEPVLAIKFDTTFEEIGCVGYEPQLRRLEAVVNVKRQSGYGGGVCSAGTPEFVRFYLSADDGATWVDQGLASFTAYDIPGPKPLAYDVTVQIDPGQQFCTHENILRARAILSWNDPPPPDDPGFTPAWGEVQDAHIQIEPRRLFWLGGLLEQLEVELPAALQPVVDLQQPLSLAQAKSLGALELHQLYQQAEVPGHRYLFPEIQKLVSQPYLSLAPGIPGPLAELDVDLAAIIGQLLATGGNTSFEELRCIGLNPNQDALAGLLTVKQPSGYSGNLCSAGSKEYVAFWIDYGAGWTYAGTTSVDVYDLATIPAGGLQYAVYLPVDPSGHRQPCGAGPVTARVRAVLSWQSPPPAANPNYVPTWGNRAEALIHIKPGPAVEGQVPFLSAAGDIPESSIGANGKATGAAIHTGFVAADSPFGGVVTIAGHISNPTPGLRYRVMIKPHLAPDSAYTPLTNEPAGLKLIVNSWNPATGWDQSPLTVHADAQGYYPFEDYSPNHSVEGDLMLRWYTSDAEDGQAFDLRIDLSTDGNPAHDVHSNVVTVMVDNTRPAVALDVDLGGGTQCADLLVGDTLTGTYSATDAHFGSFSFEIQPSGPPNFPSHGALPVPPAGQSTFRGGAIADPGVSGATYTLDTGPMDPCGYALILHVWDRTNVNSGAGSHHSQASVGFCLNQPEP